MPGQEQLQEFLKKNIAVRGTAEVTAAQDLCTHAHISPLLRNAALSLVGSDLYKKIKPPGDTTLHSNSAWSLESLVTAKPADTPAPPAADRAQLAAAFSLLPGCHALPQAAKGPRVLPPGQQRP